MNNQTAYTTLVLFCIFAILAVGYLLFAHSDGSEKPEFRVLKSGPTPTPFLPWDSSGIVSKKPDAAETQNMIPTPEQSVLSEKPVREPEKATALASRLDAGVCGDGSCDASEACGACLQDCACDETEVCRENTCVLKEACGDGVCTEKEKGVGCCNDCGCGSKEVCNIFSNKCLSKVSIPQTALDAKINEYLRAYGGKVLSVEDSYCSDRPAKQVTIDCSGDSEFACIRALYIDEKGNTVCEV